MQFYDTLDGLLLGDGSLWQPPIAGVRRTSNSYYRQSSVSRDWLDALALEFHVAGFRAAVRFDRTHVCKDGRRSDIWWLQAQAHAAFTAQHARWYPRRRKMIPADITLTRLSVLQWFLGDGTMVQRNKKRRVAILCTEGFDAEDVDALVLQLRTCISHDGVSTYARRQGVNVSFSYDATDALLDFLGPAPHASLAYKWDTRLERA